MDYIKKPMVIEEKSFEIITKELGEKINEFTFLEQAIVKRVIHTTADFDYANIIKFVKDPIKNGIEALKSGCKIYCDTNMIVNGLNETQLQDVLNNPKSCKLQVSMGRLMKLVAETQDLVPTDGNHSKLW